MNQSLSPQTEIAHRNYQTSIEADANAGDDLTRKTEGNVNHRNYGNGKAALKIRVLKSDLEVDNLKRLDVDSAAYFDELLESF